MHYFRNFKSFAEAELELLEPVTLLIGPNGSGKSNLIEGVELLAHIAHGLPLHEIVDAGRGVGSAIEVRGGLEACPRNGGDTFTLGFRCAILTGVDNERLDYEISVTVDPIPHISEERLEVAGRELFSAKPADGIAPGTRTVVRYGNLKRGRNPKTDIRSDRSALSQYNGFAQELADPAYLHEVVGTLQEHLRSSFVFDPDPKTMRGYERTSARGLARNGANLSAVLCMLSKRAEEGDETLSRVWGRIRQVPDEAFNSLEFVETKLGDAILGFGRSNDRRMHDARVLSDGTLRCLAVLTALETVEPGSRIVIEELDNGLHPSRVQMLLDALHQCAKARELNVLATTHNPATLNSLSVDQLGSVVACTSDGDHSSQLVRLRDLPSFIELAERGPLGDLVTRRVLEQFTSPEQDAAHQAKVLEWLESLA